MEKEDCVLPNEGMNGNGVKIRKCGLDDLTGREI